MKIFLAIAFAALLGIVAQSPSAAQDVPDIDTIEAEITRFQEFFTRRFREVPLEDFALGVVALPQDNRRAQSWRMLMWAPPQAHLMQAARDDFAAIATQDQTLETCMSNWPPANRFPVTLNGTIVTIREAVSRCLASMEIPLETFDPQRLTALVAVYRARANGDEVDIDITDPDIRAAYARGRQVFWSERGQMGMSCASCHVENAGNSLRGNVIGAALGQGNGSPVYSLAQVLGPVDGSQGGNGGALLSLHERYQLCYTLAGTEPMPQGHKDYVDLEVYQGMLNRGIPILVPGLRH